MYFSLQLPVSKSSAFGSTQIQTHVHVSNSFMRAQLKILIEMKSLDPGHGASSSHSSSPAPPLRLKWTPKMERVLLETYNEVVTQKGDFSDGTSLANSH